MLSYRKLFLLLFIAVFGLASAAMADEPVPASKKQRDATRAARAVAKGALQTGTCSLGNAFTDLDINNVRGRLFNNGGLFWKGAGNIYTVPKTTQANAIFASGIWIGGLIDGQLHMIASDYGPWELWPGPLDDQGNAPADCSPFDRMFKVNKQDVLDFEDTGVAAPDLADWPFDLGAPVVDGDGNPNNYNLAGGDRPEILGDQTVWWVMNDVGNEHSWSLTPAIGLEVQVTAFAFKRADALNNTTFFNYKLINKGGQRLTETYFGIWSDPDLGDAGDDYVGSDPERGIGYVWNGDDFDGSGGGYGDKPPATGYDFFQGPLVNNDGVDNDEDGDVDEEDERIAMTKFIYYNNDSTVQGNPDSGDDAYRYLRGLWRDDVPVTFGGSGRGFSEDPANFMFPADPPAFWSEENVDDAGSRNTPADRRFLMSSGPFTLDPGAVQEIVYGIVWAQAADRFASVQKMKSDDALAQAAFNVNFELPPPPDAPRVEVSELDGTVILSWGYRSSDNNFLDSYDVFNPFLADVDVPDKTYSFEGYNVYRFASPADAEGQLIATFDVVNNVTTVVDVVDATLSTPLTAISANGSDSGLQHSIQLDNLTNYADYYYGVQAYGYNEFSDPRVQASSISRVTVRPSRVDARDGGSVVNLENSGADLSEANGRVAKLEGGGGGFVAARVVDPGAVTGDDYRVEFYDTIVDDSDPEHPVHATNYRVINTTTGQTVFDGDDALEATGGPAPQGSDLFVLDGLSWAISGPAPGPLDIDGAQTWAFIEVQGPGGVSPCDPPAGSTFGCAEVGGNWIYGSFNGTREYIMYHQGTGPEGTLGGYAPNDYEIRFTEAGSYAYLPFTTGAALKVPYEVWDIGPTGPFGQNDPSDDVQMIPNHFPDNGGECEFAYGELSDATGDAVFGRPATDRVYAYYPTTTYADWAAAIEPVVNANADGCPVSPETDEASNIIDFGRGRPLQRVIFVDNVDADGDGALDGTIDLIQGSIQRFLTTKPNLPGDVFSLSTAGLGAESGNAATAKAALELIGISPNPYKGASDYETTNLADVARFINLPEQATIRVFTLDGSLIKTIVKNSQTTSIDWDLNTEAGLPIASGMYLIHVEVPGVGEKVIKFGVVKKRIQLDLL